MPTLQHSYPFDPSYGYNLTELLQVGTPEEPWNFDSFWEQRFDQAICVEPRPQLTRSATSHEKWIEYDLTYQSTGGARIGGWCLLPKEGPVERLCVVVHGYGGRDGADTHFSLEKTALLFPCTRGIGLSPHSSISAQPAWHVLHDIQDPDLYVHGGCVEDVWLAVTAGILLFPEVKDRIGLLGVSFGGGIGAMALGFDSRISRAHFNVPSFGNNTLRLSLETLGSGAAVKVMHRRKPEIVERTLAYFDAATTAKRIRVPVHCACALFDPMVAPPGQFAIYNAISSEKKLFVLTAGHFEYPEQLGENASLLQDLNQFFDKL